MTKYSKKELLELKESCQKTLNNEEEPDVTDVVGYLETIISLCDELVEYKTGDYRDPSFTLAIK